MTPERVNELADWFFAHDNEWQNDYLSQSKYDPADIEFWEEIERIYGDLI